MLKEAAAVIGPIGYAMKGVHKELTKSRTPIAAIRRARAVQGERELAALSPGERKEALERAMSGWAVMKELWAEADRSKRGDGLVEAVKGRVRFQKEKRVWEKYGAFESVDMSHKALEAHKQGVSIDKVLGGGDGPDGEKAAEMVDRKTADHPNFVDGLGPQERGRSDANEIQGPRIQQ